MLTGIGLLFLIPLKKLDRSKIKGILTDADEQLVLDAYYETDDEAKLDISRSSNPSRDDDTASLDLDAASLHGVDGKEHDMLEMVDISEPSEDGDYTHLFVRQQRRSNSTGSTVERSRSASNAPDTSATQSTNPAPSTTSPTTSSSSVENNEAADRELISLRNEYEMQQLSSSSSVSSSPDDSITINPIKGTIEIRLDEETHYLRNSATIYHEPA
jgi:hypothetical protein